MAGTRQCPICGAIPDDAETHVCPMGGTTQPERPAAIESRRGEGMPDEGDVVAGRYRLLRKIGEGGSGIVFRAHDRDLDIEVALKLVAPDRRSDALLARLKREIRITRDVDHPNVSRVFDLGEAGSLTFLTMRWIDGEPLRDKVRRDGPLGKREIDRLARGLIAALAAVHRAGVVHRDVTPANVIVSTSGEPVLVDFGIATTEGDSGRAEVLRGRPITLSGHVPGTPAYMAPEQRRGEATPPATDLWSLALTLAFAATGEVAGLDDPARMVARYDRPLRRLLLRCLAEDPSRRPRDAVGVELAIRAARRRRTFLRVGLPGVVVLLAALFAATRLAGVAAPTGPPLVWVAPLENRTGDAEIAWLEHGAADLLAAGFESSGRVRMALDAEARRGAARVGGEIVRGPEGVRLDLVLHSPDGAVEARDTVPRATGNGLFRGVDAAVGRFLASLGVPHPQGDSVRARPPVTREVEAFAHYARAEDLARQRRNAEALEELRRATARDPGFALAHLARYVHVRSTRQGSGSEAAEAIEAARRHRDRLPPAAQELLDAILEARGAGSSPGSLDRLRAYLRSNPPDAATYRMAARMHGLDDETRRAFVEEWASRLPDDPEPHNQLGYLLLGSFGDAAGAEREFREYLRLAPDEPNAHDSYGDFLRLQGRHSEALGAYDRALEIDPTFSPAAVHAIDAALRAGDLDGADERLEAARRILPTESRDFDLWTPAYAAVPLLGGDEEAATRRLRRLAEDPAFGSRAYVARAYEATLHGLRGRAAEARRAAEEADRMNRLYHGPEGGLPTLPTWVEGLAASRRRDVRRLRAAATWLEEVGPRMDPDFRALTREQAAWLAGRALALQGDPTAAAARFIDAIGVTPGVAFLARVERGRVLDSAGRLAEADRAYAEAIANAEPTAPEVAYTLRACLAEAEDVARRLGDSERAEALAARLEALRWPGER